MDPDITLLVLLGMYGCPMLGDVRCDTGVFACIRDDCPAFPVCNVADECVVCGMGC